MGDEVFGFVTINAGITIHRTDCPNAARLRENYPYRIMEARWREQVQGGAFRASIKIVADDTTGMVNRITEVINRDLKLNIRSMNLSSGGGTLSGLINVEVPSTNVVDMLIHSILRIRGVQRAYRVNN
jgi:GTP pyrophosphokinase